MSLHTNPEYFTKLIIFVTLFREYVNIVKKGQVQKDEEFTAITNAEDVPDISNEFINEFLEPEKGGPFGFDKEESIDLTQNICHWMYENNFTCSKLSLISKYNSNNNVSSASVNGEANKEKEKESAEEK